VNISRKIWSYLYLLGKPDITPTVKKPSGQFSPEDELKVKDKVLFDTSALF